MKTTTTLQEYLNKNLSYTPHERDPKQACINIFYDGRDINCAIITSSKLTLEECIEESRPYLDKLDPAKLTMQYEYRE
jgi:hypothetical protein